ncbi:NAD(P)-dependent alcohol dehydrogenase [Tropicimonas marinistellae]|uniref:NAD(P)-dependent alcohol dehydrogenase n=1 Tax=Tropicimonas marinistellae TaxID=1739787 RepID=UPI000835A2E8|nr:NAD(P)-dependent alcohol dehydrogenase [Tropicimonas marinistellae]
MKAIKYDQYGPASVLDLREVPRPEPGRGELLVRVAASAVTTADWRLRASAFPGGLWLPGRLMTGLRRPRKNILGGAFAGEVVALGEGAETEGFSVGDPVFGFSGFGAHAEYLAMPASGAVVKRPEALSPAEAASLPFGGLSALVFLRDVAKVQPGHRVLIVGATGAVGALAVQIARALGAEVTGVSSTPNLGLARELGAQHVIDYRTESIAETGRRFDVVFDTVGALDFAAARGVLAAGGVFAPLNFGLREMAQALFNPLRRDARLALAVSGDRKADLEELAGLVASGNLRPVVDQVYPLAEARAAHLAVESRHRRGTVLLAMPD